MDTSHYYEHTSDEPTLIHYNGRAFFNRFKRVDSILSAHLINRHFAKEITIAHNLIMNRHVENIVIDYNGVNSEVFYHKAQLLLREMGFLNFTAYRSKTKGHLHIYIHKGHTEINEAKLLAKELNMRLEGFSLRECRIFPTDEVPPEFNILVLPYDIYAKERATYWSKYM